MKKTVRSICQIALMLVAAHASAQWYNPEKVTAKAQFSYRGALDALQEGDMPAGKALLIKALNFDPRFVDAWLSYAGALGQLKQYDSATLVYQKAFALDSIYGREFLLPYSINLAGLGNFEAAQTAVMRLLNLPHLHPRTSEAAMFRKKQYAFALSFTQKHGLVSFEPVNLGDSINSPQSEYYPSFTIDDSLLVFTRKGQGIREDFIKTNKTSGGYLKARPVGGKLNESPRKGGTNVSPDGEWLFYAGNFQETGFGNFDIYMSYATPEGWSDPYNLGENVNTEFWESSPSISPDKQTLYFSSNRPGGFGGKDLYITQRQKNGSWSPAENMGPNFNTASDELAPFIHPDNQTLYFTSGGHPGYGGSDVYFCRKGPGGQWSLPENMGYPINTIEDEGSLIVTANGKTAYYASIRADSRGGLDLYAFDIPAYARPKRTLWVKGNVMDANTKKGLPTRIELKDIATGQILERVQTNETGNFLVTLPVGRNYTFTVNRTGYLFYSDEFMMADNEKDSVYQKNIYLIPLALNSGMALKNILFETNSFKLNSSSFTELDKLFALLVENPKLKLQINGHTDNVGKAADNLLLSSKRARAIVDYLVEKGIAAPRLASKGFGSTKPLSDNSSETGRTQNRRTEIEIIGL